MLRCMRSPNDAEVVAAAERIAAGKGVVEWPAGLNPMGACACLLIDRDGSTYFAYAPGHTCDDLPGLQRKAAAVLLDFADRGGPDEGWVPAYADGTGFVTWLSMPGEAARQGGIIPASEMPPLD